MIHSGHPFRPDPGERDLARQFRGRLAAGVTIVTAGVESTRTGLTVSSLLVIQGDPALAHLVVGPTTDLWAVASATGRFVIHICRYDDRHLADVFAGLWPAPGGPFATTGSSQSDWGPVLDDLPDRAPGEDRREEHGESVDARRVRRSDRRHRDDLSLDEFDPVFLTQDAGVPEGAVLFDREEAASYGDVFHGCIRLVNERIDT